MKRFMKATCTTLAVLGLCAASAFATDYNGEKFNEVGGLTIGPDGSTAAQSNQLRFDSNGRIDFAGPEGSSINFNDWGNIIFGGTETSGIFFDYKGVIGFGPEDINGNRNQIYSDSENNFNISAANELSLRMDDYGGAIMLTNDEAVFACSTIELNPLQLHASGLFLKHSGIDSLFSYETCLSTTEGTLGIGISEISLHPGAQQEADADFKHGIEIDEEGFIWSFVAPYEYDGASPNWDDPGSIDPTKVHRRFTVHNVSAGKSGADGDLPDGYAAGSAGRSVMMFSWKEPLFSYDSLEDELVMDFQDPSAELWLYEEKEGENDDVDARLIAFEGHARLMTQTASTGAVKAEVRAESDGDVVIRLGSN